CALPIIMTNMDIMKVLVRNIKKYDAPYIMDPVMVATSGDPLNDENAQDFLRDELLPQTAVVTPNIPDAENITGEKITDEEDMKEADEQSVTKQGAKSDLVNGG